MAAEREQANAAAEPWMRGTHPELDALRRGVVHALELAAEDVLLVVQRVQAVALGQPVL